MKEMMKRGKILNKMDVGEGKKKKSTGTGLLRAQGLVEVALGAKALAFTFCVFYLWPGIA